MAPPARQLRAVMVSGDRPSSGNIATNVRSICVTMGLLIVNHRRPRLKEQSGVLGWLHVGEDAGCLVPALGKDTQWNGHCDHEQ